MRNLRPNGNLRLKIGAVVYDMPSFLWHVRPGGEHDWTFVHNRNEILATDAQKRGARCEWQWTSDLHITKVFPVLGLTLMRKALRSWPVVLQAAPTKVKQPVDISFVIGHRGKARMPHLLTTVQSIGSQRDVNVECVVVDQSISPEVKEFLPAWVNYLHLPQKDEETAYCRSAAFNAGAKIARGSILVLHDNDLLIPQDYAAELMKRFQEGYEVINLKRFIFYLSKDHTQRVHQSGQLVFSEPPESVMQNSQGGGSLAISRDTYFALGGFDESFVGWGGEDNEFWERAQTRSVWEYGYLPFLHLWHESQAEKLQQQRDSAELFQQRSAIPVSKRIVELKERNFPGPVLGEIIQVANSQSSPNAGRATLAESSV